MQFMGWKEGRFIRKPSLIIAFVLLVIPKAASAAQPDPRWSLNFTPVIIPSGKGYRSGGGLDPEVKYTLSLNGVNVSAGIRVGGYSAKNLFGWMAMPTVRLTLPIGKFEPYAAFGQGYGRLPKLHYDDVATMSRLGFFVHVSEKWGIGIEGTYQEIQGSDFEFYSYGSMVSFDL